MKENRSVCFRKMGSDLKINNETLSYRFRCDFLNLKNEIFFIEFSVTDVTKGMHTAKNAGVQIGDYVLFVDHLFRKQFEKLNHDPEYRKLERSVCKFESLQTCLDFLNLHCDCDFKELVFEDEL